MYLKKFKFNLERSFNIYFFAKSHKFIYIFSNSYIMLKLFFLSFLKIDKNYFYLIFLNRSSFFSFYKHFLNIYNRFFYIYFFKLKLKGLGYRVVRICKSLYRFYFINTNFLYLHLPLSVFLKVKSRRLLFFGFDLQSLRFVFVNLLLLNKTFIYFIRGLLFPKQIIVLKPGKKRL